MRAVTGPKRDDVRRPFGDLRRNVEHRRRRAHVARTASDFEQSSASAATLRHQRLLLS